MDVVGNLLLIKAEAIRGWDQVAPGQLPQAGAYQSAMKSKYKRILFRRSPLNATTEILIVLYG